MTPQQALSTALQLPYFGVRQHLRSHGIGDIVDDQIQDLSARVVDNAWPVARDRIISDIPALVETAAYHLKPRLKEAAVEVAQDLSVQQAIGAAKQQALLVAAGACLGTAVLTWALVKYVG